MVGVRRKMRECLREKNKRQKWEPWGKIKDKRENRGEFGVREGRKEKRKREVRESKNDFVRFWVLKLEFIVFDKIFEKCSVLNSEPYFPLKIISGYQWNIWIRKLIVIASISSSRVICMIVHECSWITYEYRKLLNYP